MRQQIHAFIDNLAQLELTNNLQLKQRVFIAYEKHVKNKLREILSIPQEQEGDFVASLEALLNEIWLLTKGTMLCYTAQPKHPVTLLMCEIARFVAENKKNDPQAKSPLGYLMPDMKGLEPNSDDYLKLDELALDQLVRSHVLSQDGKYLLPVSLLLSDQYKSIEAQPDPVRNPYWDTADFAHVTAAFVSPPDLTKLEKHSNSTMAMAEAKRALCQAMDEKSNLLGHLRELVRSLTLNDVNHRGSEVNAAGGAYPAIIRFRDYYQSLTEKDNSSIPDEVKAEIETLLGVAFDAKKNTNATDNVATCIATRKDDLMSAMSGNDAVLSTISAGDESKAACIKKAQKEYDEAQESLKAELQAGGQYAGHDQLPITKALVSDLNLTFSIGSYSDLLQLTLLSSNDLEELLNANGDLKTQIVNQLKSINDLAGLSIDLSCENLTVLLTQCGDAIVDNLTICPQYFGMWLSFLCMDKCTVICQALRLKIPEMLKECYEFEYALKMLTLDKRTLVYQAMKDKLLKTINSVEDFGRSLRYLTPAQCKAVCQDQQYKLLEIITCGNDFGFVMWHLTLDQRTVVYEAMKDKLPQIIQCGNNFRDALKPLTPEECTAVCQTLQHNIVEIIEDGEDFGSLLNVLNPAQCTAVCQALHYKPAEIFKDVKFFRETLRKLTLERFKAVCQALQHKLPETIKSGYDFGFVMWHFTLEQRKVFLQLMKVHLLEIIKNVNGFKCTLEHLTQEQRIAVYDNMKNRLPQMIEKASDFREALHYLTQNQRTVVYEAMEGNIASLIFSGTDVGCVLEHLTSEQCRAVCNTLKDDLLALINHFDIKKILRYFTAPGFIAVFQDRSTDLINLIHNARKLGLTLDRIGEPGCIEVCKLLQDRIPEIIQYPDDIVEVIKMLKSEALVMAVCSALKDRFLEIIKSGVEIALVLRRLTYTPNAVTLVLFLQKELPGIIKNVAELEQVLLPQVCMFGEVSKSGTEAIQSIVYEAMKDKLTDMIKSGHDLRRVLYNLNLHRRNEVYEAVKNKLPTIIHDGRDFREALEYLRPEQITDLSRKINTALKPEDRTGASAINAKAIEDITLFFDRIKNNPNSQEATAWKTYWDQQAVINSKTDNNGKDLFNHQRAKKRSHGGSFSSLYGNTKKRKTSSMNINHKTDNGKGSSKKRRLKSGSEKSNYACSSGSLYGNTKKSKSSPERDSGGEKGAFP